MATIVPAEHYWRLRAETKNTWHRPDPSFTYLLSFFLLLTALAWGLAYTPGFGAIIRLAFLFVFVHFIGSSLLVSTIGYFIIGRLFGPNGAAASLAGLRGSRGRRRGAAQGLFTQPGEKEQLEFGYCFDVRLSARNPVESPTFWHCRFIGIQPGLLSSLSPPLRGAIPPFAASHPQPE